MREREARVASNAANCSSEKTAAAGTSGEEEPEPGGGGASGRREWLVRPAVVAAAQQEDLGADRMGHCFEQICGIIKHAGAWKIIAKHLSCHRLLASIRAFTCRAADNKA